MKSEAANHKQEVVEVEMSEHRSQIVDAIKKHAVAPEQYSNGWDVIVETLSDPEIAVLTGKTADFAGARRRVSAYVRADSSKLSQKVMKALHEFQDAERADADPAPETTPLEDEQLRQVELRERQAGADPERLAELAAELKRRGLRKLPNRQS
jgi:hypothetical protein